MNERALIWSSVAWPMVAKNGQAAAYVCQEFACKLPTTSIVQMLENLRQN